jgi:tetratricopeptide (TPR) repeat protein
MNRLSSLRRPLALFLLVSAASIATESASIAADDLALCNTSASNPDAGIPACTRLIDLGPRAGDLSAIYTNRGSAWYRKGQFDNAIADFSEAIQRDPNNIAAYRNRVCRGIRKVSSIPPSSTSARSFASIRIRRRDIPIAAPRC